MVSQETRPEAAGTVWGDIRSRPLLIAKGGLFLVLAAASSAVLLAAMPSWQAAVLLGIAIWSSCRFYYFLFYVLERYAGVAGRYAGLLDLVRRLAATRRP